MESLQSKWFKTRLFIQPLLPGGCFSLQIDSSYFIVHHDDVQNNFPFKHSFNTLFSRVCKKIYVIYKVLFSILVILLLMCLSSCVCHKSFFLKLWENEKLSCLNVTKFFFFLKFIQKSFYLLPFWLLGSFNSQTSCGTSFFFMLWMDIRVILHH